MTTFKVGDKVRVLDVSKIWLGANHYYNGMETEVVELLCHEYPKLKNKNGEPGVPIAPKELHAIKLISPEDERITALEKQVAELQKVVDGLKKPLSTQTIKVEVDTSKLLESIKKATPKQDSLPQSNNQKRAAIIEKAKKFVEEHEEGFAFDLDENVTCAASLVKLEDEVVYEAQIGYSKCHPQEVKNDFIGKAIALGRAKHINVSEFEQAVQPDEVVVGMVTEWESLVEKGKFHSFRVARIGKAPEGWDGEGKAAYETTNPHKDWMPVNELKITNDTDAVY